MDFDGTLSLIMDDPEAARPLEGMVELLRRLAARFAAVALVSGRPADFLATHAIRRVADPGRWAGPIDQAAREIAAGHGLEVVPSKLVWELRPAVPSDKGDAVCKVVAESGGHSVMVAGDDLGDLAAFAAAPLAAEGSDTLRVAVRSAEAPEPLLADADLVVDGPPELRDFLERPTARPGSS